MIFSFPHMVFDEKQRLFLLGNPGFASKPLPNLKTAVFLAKTGLLWSKNDTILNSCRCSHRSCFVSPERHKPLGSLWQD